MKEYTKFLDYGPIYTRVYQTTIRALIDSLQNPTSDKIKNYTGMIHHIVGQPDFNTAKCPNVWVSTTANSVNFLAMVSYEPTMLYIYNYKPYPDDAESMIEIYDTSETDTPNLVIMLSTNNTIQPIRLGYGNRVQLDDFHPDTILDIVPLG